MRAPSPREAREIPALEEAARAELASQLRALPAFRALLRSVEATLVAAATPLPTPVLDLGCGDGDFGSRSLRDAQTLGIDSSVASIAEAHGRYPERSYCAASATQLPLVADSMGAVVANSVLEHIADLEGALAECARLLRPGGQLVVTAPSHRFTEFLLVRRILVRLGLASLADRYGQWFNKRSRHYHLLSKVDWRAVLGRHGFRVIDERYYFSRRAHAAFEVQHYLGVPTLLLRRLTGQWLPRRNPVTYRVALRWLSPLATPVAIDEGAYLFLIAEREA
jgi:ubiquinone/menaquinone biosynthesis C-methylase UbiE